MTRAFDSRGGISTELFEEALASYLADYDASPYHLTEKYDGIDELVVWLRDNGIKLAVLSNKQDISTRAAVKRFFGDAFDIVHGGREGIPLKPNPDGCYEILSKLGFSPDECAYIGDSDVDAVTGKNMGARLNVSALWGFRTKEELVAAGAVCFASSPRDIIKMIEACID
jgi:phosphoglycolate phosphatase